MYKNPNVRPIATVYYKHYMVRVYIYIHIKPKTQHKKQNTRMQMISEFGGFTLFSLADLV